MDLELLRLRMALNSPSNSIIDKSMVLLAGSIGLTCDVTNGRTERQADRIIIA